jgi:hypothetical protein
MCFYELIGTFNCPFYTTDRLVKNNIRGDKMYLLGGDKMYLQALNDGFVVLEPGVEFLYVGITLPKVVSVSSCTNMFSLYYSMRYVNYVMGTRVNVPAVVSVGMGDTSFFIRYDISSPTRATTTTKDYFHLFDAYAPINVNPQRGGGGYLIINCIPALGILISILGPSWGNLNRMTFINILFIAIYCKMVGHLTNIYCPTVGHLIENLLKKSNA